LGRQGGRKKTIVQPWEVIRGQALHSGGKMHLSTILSQNKKGEIEGDIGSRKSRCQWGKGHRTVLTWGKGLRPSPQGRMKIGR